MNLDTSLRRQVETVRQNLADPMKRVSGQASDNLDVLEAMTEAVTGQELDSDAGKVKRFRNALDAINEEEDLQLTDEQDNGEGE